jgi:valyl-tRNA synthetase
MITLYPVRDVRFYDDASEASMALVQKVIVALRTIRADRKIPQKTKVTALLAINDDYKKTILEGYKTIIAEQGNCGDVRVRRTGASFSGEFALDRVATEMAGDVEVMVPMDDITDSSAEREKLQKDLAKSEADRDYLRRKLGNADYQKRAPLEVVEKDRARLVEAEAAIAKILEALGRLGGKS